VKELTAHVLGVEPINKVTYSTGPKLLMNAATLAAATMIAVRGAGAAGGETTFFTAIPVDAISPIYETTKWKQGAALSPDRNANQANREKSDQGFVDRELHEARAEAIRLRAAATS
jgi:hypothetical protein